MAESARTRSSSPPVASIAPVDPALESLALQACDDATQLHEVLQAHICIEKLVTPNEVGEPEDVAPTRSELGALLRLANTELRRCVDAMDDTTALLHQTLTAGESGKKLARSG